MHSRRDCFLWNLRFHYGNLRIFFSFFLRSEMPILFRFYEFLPVRPLDNRRYRKYFYQSFHSCVPHRRLCPRPIIALGNTYPRNAPKSILYSQQKCTEILPAHKYALCGDIFPWVVLRFPGTSRWIDFYSQRERYLHFFRNSSASLISLWPKKQQVVSCMLIPPKVKCL